MFLYYLVRLLAFVLCKFFFHLEIKGREYIPQEGGFVLVSNHASFLDPIILSASCPRVIHFAARDTLFRNRFFAALISRLCAFPIKRWSADLAAVKESVRRLKANAGLLVFPQGTRNASADIDLQNITYGFVLLAHRAGVPIIPVWISGSNRAWGKGDKMIRLSKIKVIFGEPIYAEHKRPYVETAHDVYKRMQQLKIYI